ncbi:hypothetical protein ACWGH3_12520 [Streptomyces sp. NPDC054884]|uniref:hypothetical protein n=1 Tax=Streptomyces sp. ME08-AFT2 TaxID=3028683 RepID=UPI0029BCFABB|nr:hypothetical protein [Streptomyces sp. ME08-AFT2]MDX3310193.1 hypothetical protein [Streptomyces sp. ME08-AFT2]
MNPAPGRAPVLTLDTVVRLQRGPGGPPTAAPPPRLALPEGMTAPLGCDAVSVPASLGRLLMSRLPRLGCVYADQAHWWWMVPSDSDYAVEWPAPAHYATGALLTGSPQVPALIHRPDGTLPYTPPIPLYLALCRLTGSTPVWSRPISA